MMANFSLSRCCTGTYSPKASPGGEAVIKSGTDFMTDEESGQKCWILHLFADFFHSASARRSSSDPAYAGPPPPRGKAFGALRTNR